MLPFLLAEMKQPWILLIPVVIAAYTAYEISSGISRFGRHLEVDRDSNPAFFWFLVLAKFGLVIFLLVTYFTKYIT